MTVRKGATGYGRLGRLPINCKLTLINDSIDKKYVYTCGTKQSRQICDKYALVPKHLL